MLHRLTTQTHLHMPLGLHEASHDPKGAEQLPIGIGGQPWNDGVIWALAGGQAVGVPLLQNEAVAPVLEGEATAIWHDACRARWWMLELRTCMAWCTRGSATDQEVAQDVWRLKTQLLDTMPGGQGRACHSLAWWSRGLGCHSPLTSRQLLGMLLAGESSSRAHLEKL